MLDKVTINRISCILKTLSISGVISQEAFLEVVQAIKQANKKPKEAFKDEQLTQTKLAKRWQTTTRLVRMREADGYIKRVPKAKGFPKYWLSDILKYENGMMKRGSVPTSVKRFKSKKAN